MAHGCPSLYVSVQYYTILGFLEVNINVTKTFKVSTLQCLEKFPVIENVCFFSELEAARAIFRLPLLQKDICLVLFCLVLFRY